MKNYYVMKKLVLAIFLTSIIMSCNQDTNNLVMDVYETSAAGNKMSKVTESIKVEKTVKISLDTTKTYQTITGIGGSFTESSAYLLNKLGDENRKKILQAYFGDDGARYSLTRTHMNSCDFSLSNYSYTPNEDKDLKDFSIAEDMDDLIPMIKDAMAISTDGFKIISSPWTAPPWMKDNNAYVGGKLLPKYYDSWALFFSKYLDAYKKEGIDIWGFTVENEPLGNGNNWESMHFSAQEMTDFVANHLGPSLEKNGHGNINILGYDQNRDHLKEWVDVMYKDEKSSKYMDGTAIHWYASTYEVFPDVLQYAHNKAPDKYLIETEGCVDAEVPHWQEDEWYWSKEGTDWGWDWAPEKEKPLHPKYVPVYRYARDIIGCLNNWVDGWVDWNMVLDKQGGPNWFKNWCLAPVIVDPESDEVYFTPMYYAMSHFSKYIRPGSERIDMKMDNEEVLATAVQNPDGSIAIAVLNENEYPVTIQLEMNTFTKEVTIDASAIQTIILKEKS
jgi:glucosylceramidase